MEVNIEFKNFEEFSTFLLRVVQEFRGTSERNMGLAESAAYQAHAALRSVARGGGLAAGDRPVSELTLMLKGHENFGHWTGRMLETPEVVRETGVKEVSVAILPAGTSARHGNIPYVGILRMWLEAQRTGQPYIIVSSRNEEAYRKAIAWLAIHTGIRLDPDFATIAGAIALPVRPIIDREMAQQLDRTVTQCLVKELESRAQSAIMSHT